MKTKSHEKQRFEFIMLGNAQTSRTGLSTVANLSKENPTPGTQSASQSAQPNHSGPWQISFQPQGIMSKEVNFTLAIRHNQSQTDQDTSYLLTSFRMCSAGCWWRREDWFHPVLDSACSNTNLPGQMYPLL